MKGILNILGLLLFLFKTYISINVKCFLIENWSVYNLKSLNQQEDYILHPNNKSYLSLNFCNDLKYHCTNGTKSQIISNTTDSCKSLSGTIENGNDWQLMNSSDPESGLAITFNNGERCDNGYYRVTMKIACDKKQDKIIFSNLNDFNPLSCTNTILASSKEACPKFNLFTLGQFVVKNYIWVGILFIVIGLFLLPFGSKHFTITVYVGSILVVAVVVFFIAYSLIFRNGTQQYSVYISFGISLIGGIILGCFISASIKIFVCLQGIIVGYLVGSLFYYMFTYKIDYDQNYVFWITILICIILFVIIAFFIEEFLLKIFTSLVGAYFIIRGISLYAGGFPSEGLVISLLDNGEFSELHDILTWRVYVYFGAFIVLFIVGIVLQFHIEFFKRKHQKEESLL